MRTAKDWSETVHAVARLGASGELERIVKRIQEDALEEAARVAEKSCPPIPHLQRRGAQKAAWSIRNATAALMETPHEDTQQQHEN